MVLTHSTRGKLRRTSSRPCGKPPAIPAYFRSPIFPIIVSSSESRLLHLSRSRCLRHGSAVVRSSRRQPNPRPFGKFRSQGFGATECGKLAHHRDAQRLAFADRERYVADPNFVPLPIKGLLDKSYLGERARLLDGDKALSKEAVKAANPAGTTRSSSAGMRHWNCHPQVTSSSSTRRQRRFHDDNDRKRLWLTSDDQRLFSSTMS